MSIENKETKFKQLAEKRVVAAIDKINLIGNLANKNRYAYSDDEIGKIINALTAAVNEINDKFAHRAVFKL